LIRTDILHDKKCIHVKLKKDTHLRLREKLFAYQLSIQAVFDEFANLIVNDEKRAMKILEDLAVKRAKAELEKPVRSHAGSKERIDELDHNTLYNMINASDKKNRKSNDGSV
jgi:hypothetical protein